MVSVLEESTLQQRDQARKDLNAVWKDSNGKREEVMIISEWSRGGAYRESDVWLRVDVCMCRWELMGSSGGSGASSELCPLCSYIQLSKDHYGCSLAH